MAGIISINKVIFASKILTLKTTAKNLNIKYIDTSDLSYDSDALKGYINTFRELCKTMGQYKALVLQDAETVRKVGDAYITTNARIQSLWENL